jgi:hypothetical protein
MNLFGFLVNITYYQAGFNLNDLFVIIVDIDTDFLFTYILNL